MDNRAELETWRLDTERISSVRVNIENVSRTYLVMVLLTCLRTDVAMMPVESPRTTHARGLDRLSPGSESVVHPVTRCHGLEAKYTGRPSNWVRSIAGYLPSSYSTPARGARHVL
ncbi:hypothetical protein LMH87_007073 [Akanthomyces muscarius]|uniref:Uncharacterized protein n=1 Tax=Akanthomyces muscarius TaxID=2231603 RepID=A0A9W8QQV3_AKAMU|nr:hypothetical protein LMH87_007073 [Akanthomyces muscarius]KAJ4165440.1 hypothetical protein LMH87_007073 [Akanthomyces muscarius]